MHNRTKMKTKEIFQLGELFERVQMERILGDGKNFVDCCPLKELSEIESLYEGEKGDIGFSLIHFVQKYFELPPPPAPATKQNTDVAIRDHIEQLWSGLLHDPAAAHAGGSLINLKYPYIVPGGRFREIYYWDSYFTMLGLAVSGKDKIIEFMLDNFAFLISSFGYIPNGNRTYFLGRSQPPFFACMVALLAEIKGDEVYKKYLPAMILEHDFWMAEAKDLNNDFEAKRRVVRLEKTVILNRYWDEMAVERPESFAEDRTLASKVKDPQVLFRNLRAACESGWDFSSRWLKTKNDLSTIHTTDLIPVDLNCILMQQELIISEAAKSTGDVQTSETFYSLAMSRKESINRYCWSQPAGAYCDYDFKMRAPVNNDTLAMAFPLFFKVADNARASRVVERLKSELWAPGGFKTTSIETGQQWDAPNGWAPLQWIAVKGLMNYGYKDLALQAAKNWVHLIEKVYRRTGRLMEKYNVVDLNLEAGGGEYPSQDGFGWTNGTYLALKELIGEIS